MNHEYTDRIPNNIAKMLVQHKYDDKLEYYIYQSMHEYSIYAVDATTGMEAWSEAVGLKYESNESGKKDLELPFKGKWLCEVKTFSKVIPCISYAVTLMSIVVLTLLVTLLQKGGN